MKICILTSAHSPFDARIFHKQARSLKSAGYDVVVVAPYEQNSEVEGIRIHAVSPYSSRLERIWRLQDIYKAALSEKADLYHFHDPDLIPYALRLRKKLKKPVIYDVHEYYGDTLLTRSWIPRSMRKVTARFVDRFEKRAAKSFDGIITVNSHMAGLFREVNPEGEVLHNYPIAAKFDFPRPETIKPPVILYLGAINKVRGLEVILKAMVEVRKKFPEASCELVGPVVTSDLPASSELDDLVKRGNLKLRGKVPYDEVPAILQRSSIALVPLLPTLNYLKAIPVKLLEYMAAGLPVVGSRFGYIEEIVSKNSCGRLSVPGDHDSLAKDICFFLEHPDRALECGQNGWDAFRREYTWEKEQEKLLALYERVLGRHGKRKGEE